MSSADETMPRGGDVAGEVAGADPVRDQSPEVYSAGDVDLEDPDNEVQTTTERTIDDAASKAGRDVAAAARQGWDDPAVSADPPGDYDLMATPDDADPDGG